MKAFPHKVMSAEQGQGMDLRDYFAAQAPIYLDEALESLQQTTKTVLTEKHDVEVLNEIARLSYLYADAMMQARNANN